MKNFVTTFLDKGRCALVIRFDNVMLGFALDLNTWCVGLIVNRDMSYLNIYLLCFYISILWSLEEL